MTNFTMNPEFIERCRICGGMVHFYPRTDLQSALCTCDGCGRDYGFLRRKIDRVRDLFLADEKRQIEQLPPDAARELASVLGRVWKTEMFPDPSTQQLVKDWTPLSDAELGILARRAFSYAIRAQLGRFCPHCGDPLITADEQISAECAACLLGDLTEAHIQALCTAMAMGGAR